MSSTNDRLRRRVEREKRSHTDEDVLAQSYALKDRFSHIWTYPSRRRLYDLMRSYLQDLEDKYILDYGCGRGEKSLRYLKNGAVVYGIDISAAYIEEARKRVEQRGFPSERYSFSVMDAHNLQFKDDTIDVVVGHGILHHLNVGVALCEIHRVLRPNGRVLLVEPLSDNPLLRLFRTFTPSARTEDEQPFSASDLKKVAYSADWEVETTFCGVLEAPAATLTSVLIPKHPDNALLQWADRLESWMHKREILPSWNQYVLFNMVKR